MMSKTHIAIGVVSSLMITQPKSTTSCLVAVLGGSVGGIISDIDSRSNSYCRDALYGRLIVVGIVILTLLIDWVMGMDILDFVLNPKRRIAVIIGAILLAASCIFGLTQKHRTFTHSFLALIIMSGAVYMICPIVCVSFIIGFLSHLLLDVLNKKPIQIFYPKGKGICLNICYASKTANNIIMIMGSMLSLASLIYFLAKSMNYI